MKNPEYMGTGQVVPDRHWHMAGHSHLFWELIIPLAGRMLTRIAGQEIVGHPGVVLLYPRHVVHEERSDPDHPVATQFVAFLWEWRSDDLPLFVADSAGRLRQTVEWLYADRDLVDSPAVHSQRQSLLEFALSHYLLCAHRNPQDDTLVRTVRDYARQHLAEPVTLEVLAQTVGLSRFHFLRVFSRLAGRSPMADVRALRLEHARELLLTTGLPLKQIAPRCGMGSEYALSRAFSRHFGYSPSELRQKR